MQRRILTVTALLVGVIPQAAHAAYIDPGTGSMILQAVVAGVAGAALLVKTYWHRLRTFFSRNSNDEQD